MFIALAIKLYSTMQLKSQQGCRLAIGAYPTFSYDARGGGGNGYLGPSSHEGVQSLCFDPNTLNIPALNWRTTKLLGLPLPPGLEITIDSQKLEGTLAPASGSISLEFKAHFRFRVGSLLTAPPLIIDTCLSSGTVQSQRHYEKGQALRADGSAVLVGLATVKPSGATWLDHFLGLPNEALAVLRCELQS